MLSYAPDSHFSPNLYFYHLLHPLPNAFRYNITYDSSRLDKIDNLFLPKQQPSHFHQANMFCLKIRPKMICHNKIEVFTEELEIFEIKIEPFIDLPEKVMTHTLLD